MQLFVVTLLSLAVASVAAHPFSTGDVERNVANARLTEDSYEQHARAPYKDEQATRGEAPQPDMLCIVWSDEEGNRVTIPAKAPVPEGYICIG